MNPLIIHTGVYSNRFSYLLGKNALEVKLKIDNEVYQSLFFSNDKDQQVYSLLGDSLEYIKDMSSAIVRTAWNLFLLSAK
jgi:hypothetical protein